MKLPWVIITEDGTILKRFATDKEAYEATLTGEYPENAEVAYIN